MNYTKRQNCRVCEQTDLYKFLSLGLMPPINDFLAKEELDKNEELFPLEVYFCKNCSTVQLLDIVDPNILFKDYHYLTGANKPMVDHFNQLGKHITEKIKTINKDSLIVDIGSNDGTLLNGFKQIGFENILGVDTASNIVEIANKNGIRTVDKFFNLKNSIEIGKEYGKADLIFGTNVFAHNNDLKSFVMGVGELLSDEGYFIIEVPYLLYLLKNLEFDTIYHEHMSYFSLTSLDCLFRKYGFTVLDVEEQSVHGSTIRVFVQKGRFIF